MKKVLFSLAVVLGLAGIAVANSGATKAQVPVSHHSSYILKDTVPSDTTKPKDSSFVKL